MRIVLKIIDTLSEYNGRIFLWLVVALIGVLSFETISRYVFNSPTNWVYETSYMIGGALAVMAWSYTHKHRGHIRVDLVYTHLPLRGRAIIDVVSSIIFLFPLLAVLLYGGYSGVEFAWRASEKFVESDWMPPAGPIRTFIFVGFCLFALQSLAQFFRDVYQLIRSKPYD
jgi:TRAP-type mannitol/chloroaromatic compound transport system permease small subunit